MQEGKINQINNIIISQFVVTTLFWIEIKELTDMRMFIKLINPSFRLKSPK